MAGNNALQFTIQFVEDKTSLNNVVQNVLEKLNNVKIDLGSKNFNLSGITEQLAALSKTIEAIEQKFKGLGNSSLFKGIEGEAKTASADMSSVATQLDRIAKAIDSGNFKNFAANIEEATKAAKALVDELSRLDTKFAKTLGMNIGKGMAKEFDRQGKAAQKAAQEGTQAGKQTEQAMAGAEARTKALVASLNALSQSARQAGSAGSQIGKGFEFNPKNLMGFSVAAEQIEKINRLIRDVDMRLNASKGLGFDSGLLEKQRQDLEFQLSIYKQIADMQSKHPGYLNIGGGLYSGLDVKRAFGGEATLTATRTELDSLDKVMAMYRKLEEMKANLQGVPASALGVDGLGDRIKGITAQVDKLMSDIKAAPDQISKSTFHNQAFDALKKEYSDVMRSQTQAEKESAKESQNIADAQKKVEQQIKANAEAASQLLAKLREMRTASLMNPSAGADANYRAAKDSLRALNQERKEMRSLLASSKTDPSRLLSFTNSDRLTAWVRQMKEGMQEVGNGMNRIVANTKIDNLLDNVNTKMRELTDLSQRAGQSNLSQLSTDAQDAATKLSQVKGELESIQNTDKTTKGLNLSQYFATGDMSKAMAEANSLLSKGNREINAVAKKQRDQNIKDANSEIKRLKSAMQQINSIQAKSPELKINGIDKATQDIQRFIALLEQAKERGRDIGIIRSAMGGYSSQNMAGTIQRLSQEQEAAARTAQQVEAAQQRMAQAINQASGSAQHQSQVLSDLRSMAAQYISVWGASSFVKEVAQITGELELQERSLSAIIGSSAKAHELFGEIKGLSQMSPFTFQDMLKSTKQLAAFGVETKDLYGTMKSLSDISAGLDVDVQRLILAYGHVKSAGVLSGIQRRQFETAGINITGEIAKLYNERYKRAGSDERVSQGDVFKMIKNREVMFKDVEQAISRLTSPGGRFFDMQLKQYDTLGGKLRNLKNNYNIMLDEIGKSYMDFLTMGVDGLNSLMENWREWKTVIVDVIAALAAAKVASIAFGKSFAEHATASAAMRKAAYMEQEVAAMGRTRLHPGYSTLGMAYADKINGSNMSQVQKIKSALYSNVAPDARAAILTQQGLGKEYIANIRRLSIMANSTNNMVRLQGQWGLALQRLRMSAIGFFSTMKAGFMAIATNPMTWIVAAVAGITTLVQHYRELSKAKEDAIKSIGESVKNDLEGINEALSIKDELTDSDTGEITQSRLDARGVQETMRELDEALQKYDPLYKGHLVDLQQMKDEAEKAKAMIEDLENTKTAESSVERSAPAVFTSDEDAGKGLGNWDSATTEMKEFEQEWMNFIAVLRQNDNVIEDFLSSDAIKEAGDRATYMEKALKAYYDQAKAANPNASASSIVESFARQGGYVNFGRLTSWENQSFPESILSHWNRGRKNPYGGSAFENLFEIDSNYFDKKKKSLLEKSRGMIDSMNNELMRMMREKKGKKAQASYITLMMDKIFSQPGKEIMDTSVRKEITAAFIEGMSPAPGASEDIIRNYNEVLKEVEASFAKEEFSDLIGKMVDTGEINENMSSEQIKAAVGAQFAVIKQEYMAQAQDPETKQAIATAFDDFFAGMSFDFSALTGKIDDAWKDVYDKFSEEEWYQDIKVIMDASVDDKEFWDKVFAKEDELYEGILELGSSIDVFHNINFKLLATMDTTSIDNMIASIDRTKVDPEVQASKDEIMRLLRQYRNLSKGAHAMGRRHTPKGASGGGGGRRHGGGGSGSKGKSAEDKAKDAANEAKELFSEMTQWIRIMRDNYKDLTERYNPMEAWKKAVEDYRRQFPEKNGPLDKLLDGKKLEDVRDNFVNGFVDLLEDIQRKIDAHEAFKNKNLKDKDREDILSDLHQGVAKERQELEKIQLDELSEKASADLDNTMESVMRDFENAKKIFEATGDIQSIADLFSSIGSGNVSSTLDEVLADYLGRDLAQTLSNVIGNGDLAKIISEIDFEGVAKMSDGAIAEYVKNMVGKKDMAQYSDTLTNWLKRFRDEYNNTQAKAFDVYAEVLGKRQDYTSLLMKIEGDVNRQLEYLRKTGAPQDMIDRLEAILRDNAALDKLKLDPDYGRFMSSDVTMSKEQMRSMFNRIFSADLKLFSDGGMTGEEMQNQSKDLLDKMRAYTEAQIDATLDITRMGYLTRQYNEAMAKYLDVIRDAYMASESVRDAEVAYKKAVEAEAAAKERYSDDPEVNDMLSLWHRQMDLSVERNNASYERRIEIANEMEQIRNTLAEYAEEFGDIEPYLKQYERNLGEAKERTKQAQQGVEDAKAAQQGADKEANAAWEFLMDIFSKMMKQSKLEKAFDSAVEYLGNFQGALDLVTDVLDSFGLEGASNVTSGASDLLGGMLGGASALSAAGPWGMAAGAALGLAGSIAQLHDKNLQRKIDEIKQDTEKMSNTLESIRALRERTLGYDEGTLRRFLANQYTMQSGETKKKGIAMLRGDATSAMAEYYGRYALGNGYEQELNLLELQRTKIIEMYNLENSKKKKSKEELEDYKTQIADLDEQIMFFVQDLANELWGIDLKGWADQLGDSLMTAFENGTSAAKAFKDTVQDIMRGVVKNMLTVGIIEPALQKLQERLFGKNGQGGIFDSDNVAGTMGATLNALGEWFNNEGPAIMNAANEFFNGADDMMRQTLGYGMMENERSTSTTDSITATASEETMGIVAGYLARVSQDVSVQRIIQDMFVNSSWPSYIEQVTSANNSLTAIDRSTTAMMEMMRDGNGALYERVENMSRRLDNFANGIDTITMR